MVITSIIIIHEEEEVHNRQFMAMNNQMWLDSDCSEQNDKIGIWWQSCDQILHIKNYIVHSTKVIFLCQCHSRTAKSTYN